MDAGRFVSGLVRRLPQWGDVVDLVRRNMSADAWPRLQARVSRADSRHVAVAGVGVSLVACGLIYLGGKQLRVTYAPYYHRFAEYFWKRADPSAASRLSAWAGYGLHQMAVWGCVYTAQQQRLSYSTEMRPLNWTAIGINGAFAVLHFAQTQLWYDGLAQDVPEMTSLGSVAFMLMLILVLESPRRGLAFGNKQIRLRREFVELVRRYHGYIFSWAIVYTFWYHPMEPTPGHLVGFGYMFMLMLQSALIFTRAHTNRFWTFALETMVIPHAVTTAIMNRNRLAPMFFFGFLSMVLMAQMHNFNLSQRTKMAAYASYLAAATASFAARRELHKLHDILRVPLLEYGMVGLLYVLFLAGMKLAELLNDESAGSASTQLLPHPSGPV